MKGQRIDSEFRATCVSQQPQTKQGQVCTLFMSPELLDCGCIQTSRRIRHCSDLHLHRVELERENGKRSSQNHFLQSRLQDLACHHLIFCHHLKRKLDNWRCLQPSHTSICLSRSTLHTWFMVAEVILRNRSEGWDEGWALIPAIVLQMLCCFGSRHSPPSGAAGVAKARHSAARF